MENENHVEFEFTTINVKNSLIDFYANNYTSFGYEILEKRHGIDGVSIKLRRNKDIAGKIELNEMQSQFEQSVLKIQALEKSKKLMANIVGYAVGGFGTAFMAGSVFCVTATTPLIVPTIILGAIGFSLWALPVFLYKVIKRKKTAKNTPLIDKEYNTIYKLCEDAKKLYA